MKRKQHGFTQEEIADMMNVSIQMISNLERGNKAIRIDNLVNLCNILNTSTDYILTGKETKSDMDLLTCKISSLTQRDKNTIETLIDYLSIN